VWSYETNLKGFPELKSWLKFLGAIAKARFELAAILVTNQLAAILVPTQSAAILVPNQLAAILVPTQLPVILVLTQLAAILVPNQLAAILVPNQLAAIVALIQSRYWLTRVKPPGAFPDPEESALAKDAMPTWTYVDPL